MLLIGVASAVLAGCGQSVAPVPANFAADRVEHGSVPATPVPTEGANRRYRAIPLPPGFVPYAMMKDGQIPGASGGGAAVYKDGTLTLLPEAPECAAPAQAFSTATSANTAGEIVGYCSGQIDGQDFAYALYFADGTVRVLPFPDPQQNNWIQSLTINDRGDIMASVTNTGTNNAPSSLARLHRDGRLATFLTGTGFGSYEDVVLNDSGHFAYTNGQNIDGFFWASIANAQGDVTEMVPARYRSFSTWLNERNSVTGYVGGYGVGAQRS
ncbi:MAG: hypothetical protein ACLQPV_10990, partial [Vulcanimicrobiaceae bacterium]